MIPVLAVDPSLRSTGWATLTPTHSGGHHHLYGRIQPRTRHHGRWHTLHGPARLAHIAAHIRHLATHHHAHAVALEGPSYNSKSPSTDEIGGLHWTIRLTLWGAHIPYIVVPPATLKIWATGHGNADKNTMIAAARDLCHYPGNHTDEADAILLHALTADALGQAYAEPAHDRRHEALTPVTRAIADLDLTTIPDPRSPA